MLEITELKETAEETVANIRNSMEKELVIRAGVIEDGQRWSEVIETLYSLGYRVNLFCSDRRLNARWAGDMALRTSLSDHCIPCSWPKI